LLDQIAPRTGVHRLLDIRIIAVHGKDEHFGGGGGFGSSSGSDFGGGGGGDFGGGGSSGDW
jgi:uncharacterized protein